ncbi:malignant fibrous histiocytoma-amplified sequence 1 homolog [Octopus vulgaris]|uniref:Malignant fibrous histiocytoma-amplified sequence 1 homolog n=1 Tax=Octopus vulgaris TaxID=6645 RepID=A0AA36F956_OCTVU|nr:malignant fibrous histiocytoma-amplified sequence 1 homolog [Octopus vulgaris]
MSSHSQVSEQLLTYLETKSNGRTVLTVPDGKYKGWLPKSLYSLELDELYLPFMRLYTFPVRGSSLGSLTSLKVFHAVGNYLQTIPNCFTQISELQKLNLSYNNLSELSQSIFKLTSLVELNLCENSVERLPPEIGELKNLRHLNIGGNLLSEVPEQMSQCKKLQILNLSGKWSPRGGLRTLPISVCNLPELLTLDCSWHQIDTLPDEIGNLKKLKILSLRGNHLKYISEKIADCTNLQELHLTAAMRFIPKIPVALLNLKSLVKLNISGNYFTTIPPEISGLENLKVFLMQKNALLQLPEEFFNLQQLEEIELSDNYLETIPGSIRRLHVLRKLSVCNNRLKSLPNEISSCQSLQSLNLAHNLLEEIPDTFHRLDNLDFLNLTENKLKRLPLLLDQLTGLEKTNGIFLQGNYLVKPRQEICDQGVGALFKYLKEIRVSEANHRRKMILTGAVKAGKTSLRNALLLGRSRLTADDERTWVLERHLWEPEESLRVQILDFGGHHIYSAAHHMFLTSEALHILVFDLNVFSCDPESYDFRIGDWLEGILDRAPGASIHLVGTHADLCNENEIAEKKAYILEKMHSEENTKIDNLRMEINQLKEKLESTQRQDTGKSGFSDFDVERDSEKLSHLQRMVNTRVILPDDISTVSCADDLVGINEFVDKVITTLKESEQRPLPKSWYSFLIELQQREEKILQWNDTLKIFTDLMKSLGQSMISMEGSPEKSLQVILKYFHATGEIIWYYDNPKLNKLVFHRPETLIDMLRSIFRHDFEDIMVYHRHLGLKVNMTEEQFRNAKQLFLHEGMMSVELLRYTLCHFQLDVSALETFTSLMLKFDLCYEIPINEINVSLLDYTRLLLFPWFLPDVSPANLASKWPTQVPKDTVQLTIQFQFPKKGPPNFFEKVSVRFQNYVSYCDGWRNGIYARYNLSKCLLQKDKKELNGQNMMLVTLSVRGSDMQELWSLIHMTWQDMLGLLHEWPFALVDIKLLCSHCIMTGNEDPYQFSGKVLERRCPKGVYHVQCPNQKDCPIPACFVYFLDPEFQEDLPKHIQTTVEFMHRCNILMQTMDDIDGSSADTGLLSDLGLRYLAAKLGKDWFAVGLQLGLQQADIERIQLDHPSDSFKQIFTLLVLWRDNNRGNSNRIAELLSALEISELNAIVAELKKKYAIEDS